MRKIWAAALLAPFVSGLAQAGPLQNNGPMIGVAMICNTPEQAEHFLGLRAKGVDLQKAIRAINTEAKDPRACGVAAVAYIRDATLDNKAVHDKLLQVVRVNIVAGFNGTTWHQVASTIQYAVIEAEGLIV